jgi:hypothetical protein
MRARLALILALAVMSTAARAEPLDTKRYMPLSEIRPGMMGTGRTTLEGTEIVEFGVTVRAIARDVLGPNQDLMLVECRGAGLEETGVIAGMSGSPVYIDGRLIGAVAFSFPWGKLPIAGIQPIEQMLRVTDKHPWAYPSRAVASAKAVEAGVVARYDPSEALRRRLASEVGRSCPVPAASLESGTMPQPFSEAESLRLQPIRTPVVVSGASQSALDRFRTELEPFGLVPIAGGGTDEQAAGDAKLAPGAPMGIVLMRGDLDIAGMGTITEIAGDRLYGFGHAMFGLGKADYPLTTGVAHLVIPSLRSSFRLGMPAEEVGRLTWDENSAVFGRISEARAPMVPVKVTINGPAPDAERQYDFEMVRHRMLSPLLAATAAFNSFEVHRQLPEEHTVAYRVRIDPAGHPPIIHENLVTSPSGAGYVTSQIRGVVGLLMNNPFENLDVTAVEVQARIEATSLLAEILDLQLLTHAVRPGATAHVRVRVRPWRREPRWLTVPVDIPADYPEGSYGVTVCGADEAVRQAMQENPARFRIRDLASLLRALRYDLKRDRMYVRLERPGDGLAIGDEELPNLPASMRSILSGSARAEVASMQSSRVTDRPVPYVLAGSGTVSITVDRNAPKQ